MLCIAVAIVRCLFDKSANMNASRYAVSHYIFSSTPRTQVPPLLKDVVMTRHGPVSTLLQSWDNSTGCPCDSAYCLRSLSSCSNVWPAMHRRTCQTIASLSLTPDRAVSGHLIHWRVSCNMHTTCTVTGALPLQCHGSGTPCRLNCNNVILSCNLSGVWRLFSFGRGTTVLCDFA